MILPYQQYEPPTGDSKAALLRLARTSCIRLLIVRLFGFLRRPGVPRFGDRVLFKRRGVGHWGHVLRLNLILYRRDP